MKLNIGSTEVMEGAFSPNGGAIFARRYNLAVTSSQLRNNVADHGGALCIQEMWGAVVLKDNYFILNYAEIVGGAIKVRIRVRVRPGRRLGVCARARAYVYVRT